jgi:hypothetical protein
MVKRWKSEKFYLEGTEDVTIGKGKFVNINE